MFLPGGSPLALPLKFANGVHRLAQPLGRLLLGFTGRLCFGQELRCQCGRSPPIALVVLQLPEDVPLAMCSCTSFARSVLSHTTIITGGTGDPASSKASSVFFHSEASVASAPSASRRTDSGLARRRAVWRSEAGSLELIHSHKPEVFGDKCAGIVVHRHTRNLDDARLDGVYQAEIRDDPGKRFALLVAAAFDVEGRRRKIGAEVDAPHSVDAIQPAHPDGRLLPLGDLLCRKLFSHLLWQRRRPIGVVGFIVDDQDVLLVA